MGNNTLIKEPRNSYGKQGFSQEEFANYQMKMGFRNELPEPNPLFWDGPDAEKKRVPFSQVEEVNGKKIAIVANAALRAEEKRPAVKNHYLPLDEYYVPDHILKFKKPEEYKARMQ